jgi:hypothetical protein
LRVPRFKGSWDEGTAVLGSVEQRRSRALAEARVLLSRIKATGARVVFEAPTPVFRAPAYRCVDWFNKNNPDCYRGLETERSEMEAIRKPILDAMRTLQRGDSTIDIWDPLPLLCTAKVCSAMTNSRPLFFDSDHLSGYANDTLYPHFAEMMAGTFLTECGRGPEIAMESGHTVSCARPVRSKL